MSNGVADLSGQTVSLVKGAYLQTLFEQTVPLNDDAKQIASSSPKQEIIGRWFIPIGTGNDPDP